MSRVQWPLRPPAGIGPSPCRTVPHGRCGLYQNGPSACQTVPHGRLSFQPMCAPYSSWLAIFLWLATAHVCFVSVGTLAFVFELNHLNVRMFQSRQCLGRCACALSRIMFVTMHG